jgi:hypothetical protein
VRARKDDFGRRDGAEACQVFKLVFDPKKVEFTSIPQDWFGVKTALGKRLDF